MGEVKPFDVQNGHNRSQKIHALLGLLEAAYDDVGQTPVARVAAGFRAQVGDEVCGHTLPVGIEVDRRGVEEREAGAVGVPCQYPFRRASHFGRIGA
jgi:hypothetical protein